MLRSIWGSNPIMLDEFKVNNGNREFQIWKRVPLGTELFTPEVFYQKLDYNHNNSVKAGL